MLGVLTLAGGALAAASLLAVRADVASLTDWLPDSHRATLLVSGLGVAMLVKIALVAIGFFTGFVTAVTILLAVVGGVLIWGVVVPRL